MDFAVGAPTGTTMAIPGPPSWWREGSLVSGGSTPLPCIDNAVRSMEYEASEVQNIRRYIMCGNLEPLNSYPGPKYLASGLSFHQIALRDYT